MTGSADHSLQIENCSSTLATNKPVAAIRHSGGTIMADNFKITSGNTLTEPVQSTGDRPRQLLLRGTKFRVGANVTHVKVSGSNGILELTDAMIDVDPGAILTHPMIDIDINNRVTIRVRAKDLATPAVLINCPHDDFHVIAHNTAPG